MQRIKVPFGGMNPEQLEVMAELAEEYSDGIAHVTTRQDFQLHFVHVDDTPALMRRLAAVGITTREACGNSVRNVTACPLSGVCSTESFDVTPYAKGLAYFLDSAWCDDVRARVISRPVDSGGCVTDRSLCARRAFPRPSPCRRR